MGTVCHWRPFWSRKSFRFIGECWYFNPQWTPEQAIMKASRVRTVLVSLEKCAITKCVPIYIGVCWGGIFWLLNESLTFNGPAALQATAVNRIGANKIPPNFNTLFATSLEVIQLFIEGSLRDVFRSCSALKGYYTHTHNVVLLRVLQVDLVCYPQYDH